MLHHDINTGTAKQATIETKSLLMRDDQRTPAVPLSVPPLHRQ